MFGACFLLLVLELNLNGFFKLFEEGTESDFFVFFVVRYYGKYENFVFLISNIYRSFRFYCNKVVGL